MLNQQEQFEVSCGLRNGNRDAWGALYRAYSGAVWTYVSRLVGSDAAMIADITQEVFIAAAKAARRYDSSRGSLWSWIAGIAHRQAALAFRKSERAQRWRSLAEEGLLEFRGLCYAAESPGNLWERQELADLVRGVLSEMPPDYAILLTAKYLDEESLDQISQSMGSSVEAIKSKLARARQEFRVVFGRLAGADQAAYFT